MYEQVPSEVVYPSCVSECVNLVNEVSKKSGSIINRGGGTSIAGQCVGEGTVSDFSRYMNGILSQPEREEIWVQPGVVLDDLNDYLRPMGLQFPIDISTSSRCTIGGMVGNNAAGSHSIIYGTTRENVLEVDVVLADGSVAHFGPVDAPTLSTKLLTHGLEGNIYRAVYEAIDSNRDAILASYPDSSVIRRNTGYALDKLALGQPWVKDGEPFNLASILCGSEGTLALLTAIRLKLSPLVGGKALACIHFTSLEAAFQANIVLLAQDGIAACELIDAHVLRAAAAHKSQKVNRSWVVGEPAAILVAEFFAESPALSREKADRAAANLKASGIGVAWPVLEGVDAENVWTLRKAGMGLLMGLRQRARPVAVIEDSAVPVHALPNFARDIGQMMERHDIDCVYYGHASVGLLHLRPPLDLDDEADRAIFRSIAKETAQLVKHYRGSLSGEHGDGRLRAPYLEDFIGSEVYSLLRKVKLAFDPVGIFNPGKIISDQPVDTGFRERPRTVLQNNHTGFDWQSKDGFDLALERCNGSGNCRQSVNRGAMCPTFQASGDELFSTRGRANLLRQAFSNPSKEELDDQELVKAMDTCLSCKACKSECPSGVDMAQMKSEYLYRRRQGHLGQLQRWVMGLQPALLTLFAILPGILRIQCGRLIRSSLAMQMVGFERKPPMPSLMALSHRKNLFVRVGGQPVKDDQRKVLLLVDPYVNHFEPEIGEAAIHVLQHLGYDPKLCFMDCSLKLLVSEGYLDEAKKGLQRLRDKLLLHGVVPIIGLEPAELLLLRDEAAALLSEKWPEELTARSFLLDEFLLHEHEAGRLACSDLKYSAQVVRFHPHCHERAAGKATNVKVLLSKVFGLDAEIISSGCCGMGGSFGYKHAELSEKIFRNNVRTEVAGTISGALLVSGTSCRYQFKELYGDKPQHFAELLRDLLIFEEKNVFGMSKS